MAMSTMGDWFESMRLQRTFEVAKAARVLDVDRPGWASLIDVGVLDVVDPRRCILAQVYRSVWRRPSTWSSWVFGAFTHNVIRLTLRYEFDSAVFCSGFMYQDAWIDEIAKRLHPVVETPTDSPVEVCA